MLRYVFGDSCRSFIENPNDFLQGRKVHVETSSFLVLIHGANAMGIFQAIGLALVIIVLRVLVPEIWNALEHTALSILTTAGMLVDHLQASIGTLTFPPAL